MEAYPEAADTGKISVVGPGLYLESPRIDGTGQAFYRVIDCNSEDIYSLSGFTFRPRIVGLPNDELVWKVYGGKVEALEDGSFKFISDGTNADQSVSVSLKSSPETQATLAVCYPT
jgi:hypothetical protein